jgi:hypothetical protein
MTGDEDIVISCIPWNKYGQGPTKEIILSVYGKYNPRCIKKKNERTN